MTDKSIYDLSILVRVRNECVALKRLLINLQKQKFYGSYEVVVIDNESTDESAKIALYYGAKVFTLPRNLFTYGRAINIGIKRCQADLIMLLSAHVWPQKENFLQSVVDDINKSTMIEAMYFKQIPSQVIGKQEKLRFSIFPKKCCVIDKDFVCQQLNKGLNIYHASYFSNSACILRRGAIQLYPMRDLPYAEENAFALDLIVHGHSVAYHDSSAVYYEGPISIQRLYQQERRRTIAEKIIEKNYCSRFGIIQTNLGIHLSSIVNVIFIPLVIIRIIYKFLSDKQYRVGSRPLVYDFCSIGGIWGRFVGILNWKKFEKTFEINAFKDEEANRATKKLFLV